MRKLPRLLSSSTAAAILVTAVPGLAASDSFVYDIVAGWTVHTDRARNFRCSMEARYEGNSVIRAGLGDAGSTMYLVVSDPAWGDIGAGSEHAMKIRFGDASAWQGRATGVLLGEESPQPALRFEVEESRTAEFMNQLMTAYTVSVDYEGREALTLSLGGSYRAGVKLEECQRAMADYRDDAGDGASSTAAGALAAD